MLLLTVSVVLCTTSTRLATIPLFAWSNEQPPSAFFEATDGVQVRSAVYGADEIRELVTAACGGGGGGGGGGGRRTLVGVVSVLGSRELAQMKPTLDGARRKLFWPFGTRTQGAADGVCAAAAATAATTTTHVLSQPLASRKTLCAHEHLVRHETRQTFLRELEKSGDAAGSSGGSAALFVVAYDASASTAARANAVDDFVHMCELSQAAHADTLCVLAANSDDESAAIKAATSSSSKKRADGGSSASSDSVIAGIFATGFFDGFAVVILFIFIAGCGIYRMCLLQTPLRFEAPEKKKFQ